MHRHHISRRRVDSQPSSASRAGCKRALAEGECFPCWSSDVLHQSGLRSGNQNQQNRETWVRRSSRFGNGDPSPVRYVRRRQSLANRRSSTRCPRFRSGFSKIALIVCSFFRSFGLFWGSFRVAIGASGRHALRAKCRESAPRLAFRAIRQSGSAPWGRQAGGDDLTFCHLYPQKTRKDHF